MGFSGFPRGIQGFLQELKAHNRKDWFDANKTRFDELVIEPATGLVTALRPELEGLDPPLQAEPKINGSIRRIYRDTRFSKDKTPYHTHLHLIFWLGGHPNRQAGVHIALDADGFGYGAGHWALDDKDLAAYRALVMADGGKAVAKAVGAVTGNGLALDPPGLKNVPRGFDAQAEGANWLRYKGLVVRNAGDGAYPEALFGPECVDLILGIAREMSPLLKLFSERIY